MAPLGIKITQVQIYALWHHFKSRAKRSYFYFCHEIVFISFMIFFAGRHLPFSLQFFSDGWEYVISTEAVSLNNGFKLLYIQSTC